MAFGLFAGVVGLLLVEGIIVSAFAKQKTPKIEIEKGDIPTADVGSRIGVLYGTRLIEKPLVVWYGDFEAVPVKSPSKK